MRILAFLCLSLSLIAGMSAASEWVALTPYASEGASPEIIIRSSTVERTVLEIDLPGFYLNRAGAEDRLDVPGWSRTEAVGLPSLPKACALLALPTQGAVSIEVLEREDRTFSGLRIPIVQPPEKDNQPRPQPVEPLAWHGLYPERDSQPGLAGAIKGLPVTSIRAYPFRLDAETGRLTVSTRMVVAVHHEDAGSRWPMVTLPESIIERCKHSVLNFDAVPFRAAPRGDTRYVIITTAALAPLMDSFALWKSKSGLKAIVRTLDQINQTAVKNIINEYPSLEYVLLVGDTADVPVAYWSGTPGDHWYACTTGGVNPDLYPDLAIGRLCGSNAARLMPQLGKIMNYEQSPNLGPWLKHTLLVAHGEQYPGKYTECKNEIATAMAGYSDWNVTKYYGGEGGTTNAGVSQHINTGVNLLNYRGHGDTTEWWSWNLSSESYYNSHVQNLTNAARPCTVLNIACCCGDIREYCMSEAWLDGETGAVASLGATLPSYTYPNHDYDKEIYRAIFSMGLTDIGSASNVGCDYILNYHGSIGADNARMYLWLGDPSMRLWMDIPGSLIVSHDTSIPAGSQDFTVTVTSGVTPVAGVTVCLYKDGEVFKTALTDGSGLATMRISPTTASDLYVTVTSDTHLPYQGTAAVAQGSLHFDTYLISARTGGTVTFTLDAGPANAGRNYILLGGMSGTVPGSGLPGGLTTMPLNFDAFTDVVLDYLNTPAFSDFLGVLDGSGQATAQLVSGPVVGSLIGYVVDFAYAMNNPWNFASNPVGIEISP